MRKMEIGNKYIGSGELIFVVAEIGINHNGSVEFAKKLIDMAVDCGCDAVKFQKRTLEKVIPEEMWHHKKETPWGFIDYIDYKRKLEFGKEEFDEIDKYCKEVGIDWFASAWDIKSQEFLDKYDLKYNKIASPMLTFDELIEHVAKQGKKTFISTGMSTWEEVDKVVNIFKQQECPFVLMHCVGIYPCPDDKLNLNVVAKIKERYGGEVGYSGHSPGIMDAPLAVSLGARYIEKHITLDRSMFGSDQSASLERKGLRYVVQNTNEVLGMLGSGRKVIYDEEMKVRNKLKYW